MKNSSSVVAAMLAAVGSIASASAQEIQWDNSAGGFWNDATNWNPMEVPNVPGESASIALPGTYGVLIRAINVNIDGLFNSNANATIGVGGGRDLRISGPIATINGSLVLNDNGTTGAARLLPANTTVLFDGSGEIVLNDTSATASGRAQIIDLTGGITSIFGPNLTVRGSGQLPTNGVYNGLVIADATDRELLIFGTPKTNNGTFRVDNGGVMRLDATINHGPMGRIEVVDGRLRLRNTISGGEIENSGGLFEIAAGNGVLDNVDRVTGDVEIETGRDLRILGGLTMDGLITVNRNGGTGGSRLLSATSGTLDGDLTIFLNDTSVTAAGRAQFVDLTGGLVTTLADTVLLHGSGHISNVFINNGEIRADADGRELRIFGSAKTNNGVFRVDNGGVMRLDTVIDQGSSGLIEVLDGRLWLRSRIVGGELVNTGGLVEVAAANAEFDNLDRVTGDVEIENGRDLRISGGLTMDGTIIVNRDGGTGGSRLLSATSGTLDGDLTIFMNDTSPTAAGRAQFVDLAGGLTTTIADTVLVHGSGQVSAVFENNGIIRADSSGREMRILGSMKTNNNLLEVDNGGILRFDSVINQGPTGRIVVTDGRLLLRSRIVGGEIDSTGGLFDVATANATLENVDRVTGDLELENGRDLFVAGGLTLDGVIVVNRDGGTGASRLLPSNSSTFDGAGEIFLNGSQDGSTPGRAQLIRNAGSVQNTFGRDFAITGNGQVSGDYVVQGTLSPGRTGSPVGETGILTAIGLLTLEDTAHVNIEVGGRGAGEFDHINGTANITVGGTLDASIIDGFEAGTCENFVIISGTSVTGEFDTFNLPVATSNRKWRLFYTGTSVDLRNTCLADIDGDCELTIFDFLAFQNLFDMGSSEADFDGDGSLTLFDFLAFQNAFSRGCD